MLLCCLTSIHPNNPSLVANGNAREAERTERGKQTKQSEVPKMMTQMMTVTMTMMMNDDGDDDDDGRFNCDRL